VVPLKCRKVAFWLRPPALYLLMLLPGTGTVRSLGRQGMEILMPYKGYYFDFKNFLF
jgi:hypothetical protein